MLHPNPQLKTIEVYIYGCNCGSLGTRIRQVKAHGRLNNIDVVIKNSKYDKDILFEHTNWLLLNGLDTSTHQPIVVTGHDVIQLSQWKP